MTNTVEESVSLSIAQAADNLADNRRSKIAGLRELADYLEQNPDLPIEFVYAYGHKVTKDPGLEEFAAMARRLGVDPKPGYGDRIELVRKFGGIEYQFTARRDDVCTPRIEDGKVVWDLPVIGDDTAPAAA